jgi:hypothetical protein
MSNGWAKTRPHGTPYARPCSWYSRLAEGPPLLLIVRTALGSANACKLARAFGHRFCGGASIAAIPPFGAAWELRRPSC